MAESKRFPVQFSYRLGPQPRTTISWEAAVKLHANYHYSQTVARLAQRGGFSRGELRALALDRYDAHNAQAQWDAWSDAPWTDYERLKWDVQEEGAS